MEINHYSRHLELDCVRIDDKFWSKEIELVRKEVIPYQYNALNDNIPGAQKSYSIENFIKAAKIVQNIKENKKVETYPADKWEYTDENCDENAFHGWVFQDSDVYKWIEAAGYSLMHTYDSALKRKADEMIDIVCNAQMDNGYLDTLYIINDRDKIFTNLRDFHELYCFGHLTEGAISYYKATGDKKLLNAAIKFADLICSSFGEDKRKGYPGHEIAEMALVKLYELTHSRAYLDTAKFFIEERGKKPYYFDIERDKITVEDNYFYNQAHKQPRHQHEAVGHAVRGVYLYSAMADIARFFRDDALYKACEDIWNNIENKKMYITGGIGATVDGEAFSFDYDLPNDLAYSETCASIGLIFFARRMLEIAPKSKYADVMERALYNTVLAGMAQDGKSFFYVNPLEVLPEASHKDSRKRHIKPTRQKWFSCACCPPNLARLISSLGEYCYTQNDHTLFVHLFAGGNIKTDKGSIHIRSDYTHSGEIEFDIKPNKPFTFAIRIPHWCDNPEFSSEYHEKDGYAYFRVHHNTVIQCKFEQKIKIIKCSNNVRANIGKAALSRGPFIYCFEEADNGKNLQMLSISPGSQMTYKDGFIIADGFREKPDDKLYTEYKAGVKKNCKIKLIPYYLWGNRGENEMSVYIRIV